jgi:hypothetical protein
MVKTTRVNVYGTFDDLIKLYRRALKKGYTSGIIEELPEGDDVVQIIAYGKKVETVEVSPQRRVFSKEFECEVIIPAQFREITRGPISKRLSCMHTRDDRRVPEVLIYRNYAERKIASPNFELCRLTLEREYE